MCWCALFFQIGNLFRTMQTKASSSFAVLCTRQLTLKLTKYLKTKLILLKKEGTNKQAKRFLLVCHSISNTYTSMVRVFDCVFCSFSNYKYKCNCDSCFCIFSISYHEKFFQHSDKTLSKPYGHSVCNVYVCL